MRAQAIEKAPSRGRESEPMTAEAVKPYYTTAIIGGNQLGPVVGWEAIKPKPTNKPRFLTAAANDKAQAWGAYLWHIDAGADQGTLEDLWEAYERAERAYNQAYEAYCQGLDFVPCEF